MPELPEVQALTAGLVARMAGRRSRALPAGLVLGPEDGANRPSDELVGRMVAGVERRGKFVCIDVGGLWLVVHLARGGWVKWYETVPAAALRPGRSPIALRVGLDDGAGFDITEMGTEKRLALWVVGLARGGRHRWPTWASTPWARSSPSSGWRRCCGARRPPSRRR